MEYEDTLRKMVDFGVGLVSHSRDKIAESARQFAEDKKLTPAQTRELVQELIDRGEKGREELQKTIQDQVQKSMIRFGVRESDNAIQTELVALRVAITRMDERIQTLEQRLADKERDHTTSD